MDKNTGAKPKGKTPFTRSTKTVRSPPQDTNPGNESTYPCSLCWEVDDKPIVSCDQCHQWYHFTCVNAPSDVANYEWFCPNCRQSKLTPLHTTNPNVDVQPETVVPVSNVLVGNQQVSSTAETVNQQVIKPTKSSETVVPDSNVLQGNQQVSIPTTANVALQQVVKQILEYPVKYNQKASQRTPEPLIDVHIGDPQMVQTATINPSRSRKSKSGTSSSYQRKTLALQKLEEERKMELEYLNKKYSILEQQSSDGDLSYDDEEVDPLKFDSIKRWTENIQMSGDNVPTRKMLESSNHKESQIVPQMSSTEAYYHLGHQEARIEDDQTSEINFANPYGKAFLNRLDFGIPPQKSNTFFDRQIPLQTRDDLVELTVASNQQNVPVTVVANNQQSQLNVQTEAVNYQQITSQEYSNQGANNPILTSSNTSQANMEGQTILVQQRGPEARAQVRSQPIYTVQASVHQSQQSVAEPQQQFQRIYRTEAFVNQTQQPVNQTVAGYYDQTSQSFVTISQPPVNNTQPFIGRNQTFVSSNQPPVKTNQRIVSGQQMHFNQPPVMSTSVYQTNVGSHQPIVSNYQQPIMSTGILNQPSNNQIYGQPFFIPNQPSTNQIYGQPVFTPTSVTYIPSGSSNIGAIGNSHIGGVASANNSNQQDGMITMQNIMSRQVIDRKLPNFDGNPEEWDAWYNRYVSTTKKCKLDNSENLDRLNKCLKGKAYTLVKSKLGQTDAVPWIISTLKKVYGRPETVLQAVMDRIAEMPVIKEDNLKQMMEFAFEVQSVSTTIESSGLLNQYTNPMLLKDLVKKLPSQTKLQWSRYQKGLANVTIKTFTEWLDELADDISAVIEPSIENHSQKRSEKRNGKGEKETVYLNVHMDNSQKSNESTTTADPKGSKKFLKCLTCGKGCRNVENCSTFNDLSIDQRWKKVKQEKLCWLCLKKHKPPCKSTNVCNKNGCSFKHHQILHNEDKNSSNKVQNPIRTVATAGNNVHYDKSKQVLLKYAPVVLYKNDKKVKTIAFFDDGSQASMLEQHLAEELGVSGTKEQLCLLWTDNIHRTEEAQRVSIEISEDGSNRRFPLNGIRAVQSLGLPAQTFKKEDFVKKYPYLMEAPIQDYENAIPGILIGTDFPNYGVQLKVIEGEELQNPIAQRTRLGWMVYGPCGGSANNYYVNNHQVVQLCPHHNQSDYEMHQRIKEFFSIENFGVRANSKTEMESKDNQRAKDLLKKFTKMIDGRYETGLLWKHDNINRTLPDSYPMAMKRLISLEKQGERVIKIIGDKIDEYVAKGYARKLSEKEVQELGDNVWYLPVFGVVNPKKPEKLRMVFDGAAKVKSVSLNSTLLTGPDELASMVDILRRLREKLIAVGGDVKEMYHQIMVRKEDQQYQLFLFRNGETDRKPDVYIMNVMTFGSRCSPAAAQYVKNTNAKLFEKTHPRAVEAIIVNHYVDDMMDGENTVEGAIQLAKDVKMIHANGGFEIRNFISNSMDVLKALGVSDPCDEKELINLDSEMKTERVLGMWWNTRRDVLTFSLKYTLIAEEILNGKKMPTKRELLRTLMSIFDPLGLLSNYLIQLKILLQDVWRMDLDWDEQISSKSLVNKWKQWLEYLPAVESVQVPRLYSLKLISDQSKSIEIHTFVDASTDAFSAVTYLRIQDEDGVDCALMGSKARVAPLKYLSIPRKELQAGILGARLMTSIIQAQRFKVDRRVFWSDSETVLSWLKSDHRKYSQFVAHRVGEILESTDVNEWRWIPTKENVADEATKWSKSINFKPSNRWFSGPEFLRRNEKNWPQKRNIKKDIEEEMKIHCLHASLMPPQLIKSENFSNWNRMVRAVAYSLRFRHLFTDKTCKGTPLSQIEISKAENLIFRQAQFEGYPSEMVILERNKSLPLHKQKLIGKTSPLYGGSPYLDADGILRMRSRIDGARDLSLNSKRPIVLPRNNYITNMLVQNYHVKYFHQNHQTVINEIRQRFYIPRLRVVVKKVRNNCQMCKVKLAKPMAPQMADLPQARLATFAKPFSFVGVDYFGPMRVKIGKRIEKRWGVLFTCLTIRAVHIDLVPSLDTNSCILCIENFIADRGEVIEFHSDCGTNFVGADNELKRELDNIDPDLFDQLKDEVGRIDHEMLKTKFTSRYTNWVFNPPSAPHMGGAWERLIRSVKTGIYTILPTRTPTEETLRNVLKGIQNVINSRPLTYIPLEIEEDEALTPNHFLYGSSSGMKAPCPLNVDGEYLRKGWKEAQRVTELFWIRFIKEYLPTIARRTKWNKPIKPLSPNDLVLVVDEKNPRNTYPKAKVLETKIGSNGQVRKARLELVAKVRTDSSGKIIKITKTDMWRPAHKLAVLDVRSQLNDGLAILDRKANEVKLEEGNGQTQDCKTGGSVKIDNDVNTGLRRSSRIIKRSGNTGKD